MRRLFTRGFVSLLLAQASFGYAASSFFLLPKFLATELGAGPDGIGQVMAAFSLSALVSMLAMGVVVDRFGRRRFLTAGSLAMSGVALLFTTVDSIGPWILFLQLLQGVAWASALIAGATLASDQAPPERLGQALGIFGLSMLAMNAVAPAVSETLVDRMGWDAAFFVAAGMGLAGALLSLIVREAERTPPRPGEIPALRSVARRPAMLRMMGVVAFTTVGFGAMMTFHQPFALSLGMTHVRSFFVAYAAGAILVRGLLGSLPDRFGRRRMALLALSVYGASVFAMAGLEPRLLSAFGFVFGLAHGLFFPAYIALALEGAGEHERGKVIAIFNASFNAGYGGSALPLGVLAASFGFPSLFVVAGAFVLAGLVLLWISPEGRGGGAIR